MAGAKGRSGRKAHLEDRTIKEIINLSSSVVLQALKATPDEFPYEAKVELASRILIKAMPQKVEGEGNLLSAVVQVYLPGDNSNSGSEAKYNSVETSSGASRNISPSNHLGRI